MSTFRFLIFVCFFLICYVFCDAQSQSIPNSILTEQHTGTIKKAFSTTKDIPYYQTPKGKKLFGKYIDSSSKRSDNLNK